MLGEASGPIAVVLRNKKVAQEFFTRVLNNQELDLVEKTIAPGYTFNGVASNAAELAGWVKALHESMPDLYFRIEGLLGAHDTVAIRWTLTGTREGKATFLSAENILVFDDDGRTVSNWQFLGTGAQLLPVD